MMLLPGDVGFDTIKGPIGIIPNIGQAMLKDACRYTHARIVLSDHHAIEAMPGGARTVDPYEADGVWYRLPLTAAQRTAVRLKGINLVGTKYSFMNYPALAWHEREWLGHNVLRKYVSSSKRMICSQLVDHLLTLAGYHLFDDGRWPQDVTPGDLFYACVEQGERVR